jgi:hypothetical protein
MVVDAKCCRIATPLPAREEEHLGMLHHSATTSSAAVAVSV